MSAFANLIPEIRTLQPKKLIGKCVTMSLAQNKTFELWNGFIPVRKHITNTIGTDLISMQVYPPGFDFTNFNIHAVFDKWAAIEVSDQTIVPEGMQPFNLPGGLYAVFLYKGNNTQAEPFFKYIFTEWLPNSGYVTDNRPHFELLGPKYKNNYPDSEEEVWIPVKSVRND